MPRWILAMLVPASLALAGIAAAPVAAAEPPPTLWQGCESGRGADQCYNPRGLVADPDSGRIYVSDTVNARIVELTAWGEFRRAWGWDVVASGPDETAGDEFEVCDVAAHPDDVCQQGSSGGGSGQFGTEGPQGLALDSTGDLYVVDLSNRRVEKFDPTAGPGEDEVEFELAFGSPGSGDSQFGEWVSGGFISVGPGDTLYVGDQNRIQKFDTGGNYLGSIPLPGETVQSLAVDPTSGDLYVAYFKNYEEKSKENVRKLSPTGELLCTAAVKNPRALAVAGNGDLYVADYVWLNGPDVDTEISRFDSGCSEDADFRFSVGEPRRDIGRYLISTAIAVNTVTEGGGFALYYANGKQEFSFVRAYYPPPDKPLPFDQPPAVAPTIADQYATGARTDSATVRAEINPHFFKDTSYWVEYGTGPCPGSCASVPVPDPGVQLGAGVIDKVIATPGVLLPGLQPRTTYHFRFAAKSSGGGPVFGPDETFATYAPPLVQPACANDPARYGAGAKLPDCRAYEMVSPVDKNGGDIEVPESLAVYINGRYFPSRLDQAAPDGDAITYSASRAFAGALSSPWSSQYIASRDPNSGWQTRSLNPPLGNISLVGAIDQEIAFKGFSEDLCSTWVVQDKNLTLAPGAPTEVPNLYRRSNCGAEGYELLSTVSPPGFPRKAQPGYLPEFQAATADGSCSVFRANAILTPDAAQREVFQLYEKCAGQDLRLLSVLPSGEAATSHSALGTHTALASAGQEFRNNSVRGAIAAGGERIFWTAASGPQAELPNYGQGVITGRIYLRVNPGAPQSADGSCDEAGKACSLEIAPADSLFWAADPGGSLAIVQTGEELYEAKIEEAGGELVSSLNLIADGVQGVAGTSTDAKRVYFVSEEALAPGAQAGKPNLYFHEQGGGFDLVAVLAAADIDPGIPSLDRDQPGLRTSRTSPDGLHLAFTSAGQPTGYDNKDAASGQPDNEVYLYSAQTGGGELLCVSCNPSGVRPSGADAGIVPGKGSALTHLWTAATLPGWPSQHQPSRLLSPDGNRLFFESYDPLVLGDTNGARDVYEWERASSEAQCKELGATLYSADAGGCLSLISSGQSPGGAELIDASADGRDVFFTTAASLVATDGESIDLYDAREGGGFAPPSPPAGCQGEACQGSPPPPALPAPAGYSGPGNVPATKKPCRKGTHAVRRHGKRRCVKNRKHPKNHKRAGRKGRAS